MWLLDIAEGQDIGSGVSGVRQVISAVLCGTAEAGRVEVASISSRTTRTRLDLARHFVIWEMFQLSTLFIYRCFYLINGSSLIKVQWTMYSPKEVTGTRLTKFPSCRLISPSSRDRSRAVSNLRCCSSSRRARSSSCFLRCATKNCCRFSDTLLSVTWALLFLWLVAF